MSLTEKDVTISSLTAQAHLFAPLTIRGVTFRNRIAVSPMCEYSSEDGFANDWHLVHLGTRAVGGAALVFTEAAAVQDIGRISPQDLGIWKDEHIEMLTRIVSFIKSQGAVAGIQLAHAGRKASTRRPWEGGKPITDNAEGGWLPVGPSDIAFDKEYAVPHTLTRDEIQGIVKAFAEAARRSRQAGFEVIEIHGAHGYLIHEFLSPISNQRTDEYGGSVANRQRIVIEIADAIRQEWPQELPLFLRLSATEWLPGNSDSWKLSDTLELAKALQSHGVDVIDASSGGNSPAQQIQLKPGYQVPFAEAIRREGGLMTAAVGLITEAEQANAVIRAGQADMICVGRELLRNPYWPLHAARQLGHDIQWPPQYLRAKPH